MSRSVVEKLAVLNLNRNSGSALAGSRVETEYVGPICRRQTATGRNRVRYIQREKSGIALNTIKRNILQKVRQLIAFLEK